MAIDMEIKNYYEILVTDEMQRLVDEGVCTEDVANDIACITLNNLPPKYYRHSVHLAFYMDPEEVKKMQVLTAQQTQQAFKAIQQRESV